MISRRKFLATAAAAIAGALTAGIVKAEKPVPVEDIQAVPLGRRSVLMYRERLIARTELYGRPSVGSWPRYHPSSYRWVHLEDLAVVLPTFRITFDDA